MGEAGASDVMQKLAKGRVVPAKPGILQDLADVQGVQVDVLPKEKLQYKQQLDQDQLQLLLMHLLWSGRREGVEGLTSSSGSSSAVGMIPPPPPPPPPTAAPAAVGGGQQQDNAASGNTTTTTTSSSSRISSSSSAAAIAAAAGVAGGGSGGFVPVSTSMSSRMSSSFL